MDEDEGLCLVPQPTQITGNKGWRLGIFACFILVLSAFLHFRDVFVTLPIEGTAFSQPLVALTDFQFPDPDLTNEERQRRLDAIGRISHIDPAPCAVALQAYYEGLSKPESQELEAALASLKTILPRVYVTDGQTAAALAQFSILDPAKHILEITPFEYGQVALSSTTWDAISLQMQQILHAVFVPPELIARIRKDLENKAWQVAIEEPSKESVRVRLRDAIISSVPMQYRTILAGSNLAYRGQLATSVHVAEVLEMRKAMLAQRLYWHWSTVLGTFLLAMGISVTWLLYLWRFHFDIVVSLRKLGVLAAVVALNLAFAKTVEYILLWHSAGLLDWLRYPVFAPLSALLLSSLLGTRVALIASIFVTIILSIGLVGVHEGFFVINTAACLIAVLSQAGLSKRRDVLLITAKAWLAVSALLVAINFQETLDVGQVFLKLCLRDVLMAAGYCVLLAILHLGFLPILEVLFGLVTDVTLMEYLDPKHPLLKRLAVEAPGTYQHSITVGQYAETAAYAIDANGLFCRVASLYHDIGKLCNPTYFAENCPEGFNMHQLLTPQESAQLIISHVTEGVQLAYAARLPEQFISIIRQHHGTTLVYYFYTQACKESHQKLDPNKFRYPGPKPYSREAGIIMLADTIEAAMRCLEEVNRQTVTKLVTGVITEKWSELQLDECQLGMDELGKVRDSFIATALAMGHTRVSYPGKAYTDNS